MAEKENRPGYRLPAHIRPVRYHLFFDVNLGGFSYNCREEIELELSKPASEIILHSKGLKIKEVGIVSKGKRKPAAFRLDKRKDRLIVKLGGAAKGTAKLIIEFEGKIREDLVGFYRSKYNDAKTGKEKHWATTQFEAAYARTCIPCFDEPEFKSTFNVSMRIGRDLQAISNMPVRKEWIEDGRRVVEFCETPKMQVYLLYLGVGQFDFLEGKLGKTTIRIVSTPGKKAQCAYALDMTRKFLKYFEDYSGIPYPLPKLDMIAVPDFASGAMENWGAITFRELILLSDPKLTSTIVKKHIAEVIAHELWHQWSGNLVTMKWWDDLWLNESFATYMAYKAVDHYFPEWDIWEDFTAGEIGSSFNLDSLRSTHPIHVEVKDPAQIGEIFDEISYNKGGSILRMLDIYLGEGTFRKGVSRYLRRYSYGSAEAENLWAALAEVSNKPIKRIMAGWINNAGYPLVEAKLRGSQLELRQKRFVFGKRTDGTVWPIPLVIKTGGKEKLIDSLLDQPNKTIDLGPAVEWYKVNYGQAGFYRVRYADNNLSKLENLVFGKKLGPTDRWGIQEDLFEMVVNGDASIGKYLDVVQSYRNEDNYLVLSDIHGTMLRIRSAYLRRDFWPAVWPNFRKHLNEPYKRLLGRLGWDPNEKESQKDSFLRELAISHLAFAEDPDVIRKGKSLYERYRKNIRSVHPNIKRSVLHIAATNGDRKTYDQMLKLYAAVESVEDKVLLLVSLGKFRDPAIAKKTLALLNTGKVPLQDLPRVVSSVAGNLYARHILFPWFKRNWKKLKRYEEDSSIFRGILEAAIASCAGRKEAERAKRFFQTHPVSYKMVIRQSFEVLDRRHSWTERNRETFRRYFA